MPFRAESSSFRAYSARKPFPFHVCTMDVDGYGNKRLTENNPFFFQCGSRIPFPYNSYAEYCLKVKGLRNPAFLLFR